MSRTARLSTFLQAASQQISVFEGAISQQLVQAMTKPRTSEPTLLPACVAACDILRDVVDKGETGLSDALAPCLGDLHWKTPAFGKLPTEISDHIAVVEIIGPDGMFRDSNVRFGLLFQREHLHYPSHSHAAEELYHVLSGTAEWSVDDQPAKPHGPGGFVHHQPWQPHAMRTAACPMLAAWGWVGDLSAASYSL